MRQATRALVASLVLASFGGACGDSERRPSGTPMTPQASDATVPRGENRAPVIEAVRLDPERPTAGDAVRAIVEATDPDGDRVRLQFAWKLNGRPVGQDRFRLDLADASDGDRLELSVTASDKQAQGAPVQVFVSLANRPPLLTAVELRPAEGVISGSEVTAHPVGRDVDGGSLSLRYTWRVNGQLVGEIGPVFSTEGLRRGDTVEVRVTASDGQSSTSRDSLPLTLVNAPPLVATKTGAVSSSGVLTYHLEVEDPDGDRPLLYRLLEAPPGMTIRAARGEIEWRPTAEQAGEHSVSVEIDDLHGGKSILSFTATVSIDQPDESPPAAPES